MNRFCVAALARLHPICARHRRNTSPHRSQKVAMFPARVRPDSCVYGLPGRTETLRSSYARVIRTLIPDRFECYNCEMGWLSENYKWLFDGVAGAAVITIIGYVIHHFLGSRDRQQGTAANITAQGAKVTDSPVASGSIQVVNSPTFNMPAASSATPAPQEETEQPPCLSFVQSRSVLLHQDSTGVWHEV